MKIIPSLVILCFKSGNYKKQVFIRNVPSYIKVKDFIKTRSIIRKEKEEVKLLTAKEFCTIFTFQ